MFDLTDKIALITGGSGVLGSTLSLGLAQAGAKVLILGRDFAKAQAVEYKIVEHGYKAQAIKCDVLDKQALETVHAKLIAEYGRIDILLNAAGGNHPSATAIPDQRNFFDLPEDALQWVFNLNLMGTLLACQVVGRSMAEAGQGVILNVSSMAAFQPLTRVVAYGSAKAGINNFTRWLAVYMAKEHNPAIRVNAIAPGFFVGEQNRFLLYDEATGELTARGQQIIDHTPMGRFGNPEDLVGTVLWLVSDASRFVTGVVVPVDGGFSAYSGV